MNITQLAQHVLSHPLAYIAMGVVGLLFLQALAKALRNRGKTEVEIAAARLQRALATETKDDDAPAFADVEKATRLKSTLDGVAEAVEAVASRIPTVRK